MVSFIYRGEILCTVDFGLLYNMMTTTSFMLKKKHVGVADWGLLSFGLFE